MAMTVGELVATFDLDTDPAARGIAEAELAMRGLLNEAERTARNARGEIESMLAHLPDVQIGANTSEADREVHALRQRLAVIHSQIGVSIPAEQAMAQIEEVRAALERLGLASPVIDVQADIRGAQRDLATVEEEARHIDSLDPHVDVHVDGEQEVTRAARSADNAGRSLAGVGRAAGSAASSVGMAAAQLGAVAPPIAGIAAALVNIVPAAAIAATAILSVAMAAAAIKIGTSGVGSALSAVFNPPASSGGGGAAKAANQLANAQRAVKDATEQAAYANKQAAQQTAMAERSLTDAQKAALQAQRDLNDARKQAARDLQDMNNQLADSQLNQRQAILDVEDAQKNLDAVKARGADASQRELEDAQLQYDQAAQRLKEQQTETKRLTADTAAANKAGVEGSKTVTDAKQQVADANRNVSDQERALADAREQQARTAAQGLESIRKAQEALTQSVGGSAGGVNKLATALAKLSPNARAFVQAIIAMKPALDALKLKVQDALFAGLADKLRTTATSVLPVLQTNLISSAGALNDMAKGAMDAAKQLADNGTLGLAMASASQGLHNLSGIPGIVVTAFGQLAAAAGPSFERLTSAVGTVAADIGKKLGDAFASGHLQDAIETAVSLIKEIGTVAGNVFSIIGSVMKATQVSGGGFIGALVTISDTLKKTFASPAVQDGLKALFSTMSVLAKTAAPLLDQALRAIAPVLTALGPPTQALIEALGKALSPVIEALGPVLAEAATAVGNLVVAFLPLLPVVGQVIADLLPTLTPLLKTLADVFVKLAPVVAQVADQIGPILTPIIAGLGEVLDQMVTQYADLFLQVLQDLIPVIPQLVPVVLQLADSLGQILTQLAPLLPQIMLLTVQFVTQLLPAILPLVGPLAELAIMFLRVGTAITVHAIGALTTLVGWFQSMKEKMQPAIDAVRYVTEWISKKFEWLADHLVGHSVIPDMINSIVAWFAGLPGRAYRALANLAGNISDRASGAASAMLRAIRSGLDTAVRAIGGLPGRAGKALANLGSTLYNSGRALIKGFIDGMKSMIGTVTSAAGSLVSAVSQFFPHSPAKKGPFSGKGWTLHSGQAIAQALAAGMDMHQSLVGASALGLAASAQQGLAGIGGMAPGSLSGGSTGGASNGGPMHLTFMIGGTKVGEAVLDPLRGVIANRGGHVQTVLGTAA